MTVKKKPISKIDLLIQKVDDMNGRLIGLEDRQLHEDAYKAALKQIKEEEGTGNKPVLDKELIKALTVAIGAIVTLVGLITVLAK